MSLDREQQADRLTQTDSLIIELVYFTLRAYGEPMTISALFGAEPALGKLSTRHSVAAKLRIWSGYGIVPVGIYDSLKAGNTYGLKSWAHEEEYLG